MKLGNLKPVMNLCFLAQIKNKERKGIKRNNTPKRSYGWQDRQIGWAKKKIRN